MSVDPAPDARSGSDDPASVGSRSGAGTPGYRRTLTTVAKGFVMGSADVVPGVSGGTMALILGIYTELIGALGALSERATWRALLRGHGREVLGRVRAGFLAALIVGIGVAVASVSGILLRLLETQQAGVFAFFTGLIAASAVVVGRRVASWTLGTVVALALGAAAAFAITGLPPVATGTSPWVYASVGAVAICALVLPGISGAFILLLLGKYERILAAIRGLEFAVLVPFGLGAVAGLLAFTRLLKWLLVHRPSTTLAVLVGFLTGSLRAVWPWQHLEAASSAAALLQPPSAGAAALALLLAIVGAGLVLVLEAVGRRRDGTS